MIFFDQVSADAFGRIYPEMPGIIEHNMADHPLFALDRLVELAARLPARHVEYNRGDLPLSIDSELGPSNGLSIADTIRGIEENGSWMVLKFVDQDPVYRALLSDALAELGPQTVAHTGPMIKQEGFVFISSPNAVKPLHFDPEHNILMQIRGSKTMTIFPKTDQEIAPGDVHERFYKGEGHRNLKWNQDYAERGMSLTMGPGEAIFVPLMAPHYVLNGPDVSISFAVTWKSAHSYREAEVRAMNAILRKGGLNPSPPQPYPARNFAKSTAYRAIRKARHVLGGSSVAE